MLCAGQFLTWINPPNRVTFITVHILRLYRIILSSKFSYAFLKTKPSDFYQRHQHYIHVSNHSWFLCSSTLCSIWSFCIFHCSWIYEKKLRFNGNFNGNCRLAWHKWICFSGMAMFIQRTGLLRKTPSSELSLCRFRVGHQFRVAHRGSYPRQTVNGNIQTNVLPTSKMSTHYPYHVFEYADRKNIF